MRFVNREAQYPGKKRLVKVDQNNVPIPNEEPVFVNIVREDGTAYVPGTPINADNLNLGNWRDDNSISFEKRNDNNLPVRDPTKTQIVTKQNGETWIVPPVGQGTPAEIVRNAVNWSAVLSKPASFPPGITRCNAQTGRVRCNRIRQRYNSRTVGEQLHHG